MIEGLKLYAGYKESGQAWLTANVFELTRGESGL